MQTPNTSLHNPSLSGGISLLPTPSVLLSYPEVLTLDVSGRIFKVSRSTLEAGSPHFRFLLSNPSAWEAQEDCTYFLDTDTDVFEHVLRFMRRPEVFPLLYDASKGFDYDLYNRLEAEAARFQMWALATWIGERKYLEAVETKICPCSFTCGLEGLACVTLPGNMSKDNHMIPRTRKTYICPRRIPVHMGAKERCGAACEKARGDGPIEYEEVPYVETVTVGKETLFHGHVCRD